MPKGHAANGHETQRQELRQGYKRLLRCLNLSIQVDKLISRGYNIDGISRRDKKCR